MVVGVSSRSSSFIISATSLKAGQHPFACGRVAQISSAISISSTSIGVE